MDKQPNTAGKKAVSPEELRRRATGGQVPPPARMPAGVKGNPPLPAGVPMQVSGGVARPVSMTAMEREVLVRAIGWKEGDPIPANMADIVDKYRAELGEVTGSAAREAVHDLPLPIDPASPPLQVRTVDIKDLPPHKRAQIQKDVAAALEAEKQAQAQAQAQARAARLPGSVQQAAGVAEAAAAAQRKITMPQQPPPVDMNDDLAAYDEIMGRLPESAKPPVQAAPAAPTVAPRAAPVIDLGGRKDEPPPPPPPEPPPPEPAQEEPPPPEPAQEEPPPEEVPAPASQVEDLGATQAMSHCPHCNGDLSQPSIPEPAYYERMSFLHSILGQKSFQKEYQLFSGAVQVVFRTLTTPEMDAVWGQAFIEKQQGLLMTQMDFWERVNRLRLYLSLVKLRSESFQHNLPDGLSLDTNPHAAKLWSDANMPKADSPSDRGLLHIEKWLLTNVLPTEQLTRVLSITANKFNRLVAKMEAMVDDADFWSETGG